jgi:hypothetical protein
MSSAGVLRRSIKHRRSRRINSPANDPRQAAPIYVTNVVIADDVLTLTFDQPVSLNGIPAYSAGSAHAIEAELTAPNVVAITFNTTITAATFFTVPYRDPAIRTSTGGFVTPQNVAV